VLLGATAPTRSRGGRDSPASRTTYSGEVDILIRDR